MPVHIIFDGPVTNLLSVRCILIEILSRAHAKEEKGLNVFKLATFLGSFPIDCTARVEKKIIRDVLVWHFEEEVLWKNSRPTAFLPAVQPDLSSNSHYSIDFSIQAFVALNCEIVFRVPVAQHLRHQPSRFSVWGLPHPYLLASTPCPGSIGWPGGWGGEGGVVPWIPPYSYLWMPEAFYTV